MPADGDQHKRIPRFVGNLQKREARQMNWIAFAELVAGVLIAAAGAAVAWQARHDREDKQ